MRARSVAATIAATVILTATASYGTPDLSPGSSGVGDPVLPARRQRRLRRRPTTTSSSTTSPGPTSLPAWRRSRPGRPTGLSSFNLDLDGLTVRAVTVDGERAEWTRNAGELAVTPPQGASASTARVHHACRLRRRAGAVRRVGGAGFIPTDDGALIAGQPHVAASWFPVNDHPTRQGVLHRSRVDACPQGVEAIANGAPGSQSASAGGWTTWTVGRARADGALPRHARRSAQFEVVQLRRVPGFATGTPSIPTCSIAPAPRTPGPVRASRSSDRARPTSG